MSRLALLSALVFSSAVASAQPPPGPLVHVERRTVELEGGVLARIATRWTPEASRSRTSLSLGDAAPTVLVHGASAATIECGERVALVAYEAYGEGAPFRVRAIQNGVLQPERSLSRPGARVGDVPFALAIAPMPGQGFAVFFEEVQADDPTATRTYLFQLDLDGAPRDAGRELSIPWPIAAAAWNGHGYHLALIYPGSGSGMRLSMVSLGVDGTNQQHPDWSSAAGYVADVHLVVIGAEIRAAYRFGDHWRQSDVTQIRSWGSEPPAAADHGALGPDDTIAVDAAGHARRVASRTD
jgi:hypothetical protein